MKLYVFKTADGIKGAHNLTEVVAKVVSVEYAAEEEEWSVVDFAWWCARNGVHPFTIEELRVNKENWGCITPLLPE